MMGQQQQTAVAGSALRRIILALTIAALIAVTMVATAAPAFAAGPTTRECIQEAYGIFNSHALAGKFCGNNRG